MFGALSPREVKKGVMNVVIEEEDEEDGDISNGNGNGADWAVYMGARAVGMPGSVNAQR